MNELFDGLNVLHATELTCDECGADIDVSDTSDLEEMMDKITSHGQDEHGWGTEEAGLRHVYRQFAQLVEEHRSALQEMTLEEDWVADYPTELNASIAFEIEKFHAVFKAFTGPVNTDNIIYHDQSTPTQFRIQFVSTIEEAHTRGSTAEGLREEITSLTVLLKEQPVDTILSWAEKGGPYRTIADE